MVELLTAAASGWGVALIVITPVVVVGLAELRERLRQRESALVPAVSLLQLGVTPAAALLVILVGIAGRTADAPDVRIVATVLVLGTWAFVVAVLRVAIRVIADRPVEHGRRRPPQLLLALPRLVAVLVALWLLLGIVWGIDLTGALAALGVTSIVVSFALQGTLSGLASGLLLLGDRPFEPGDWIESGGLEGQVLDVNWRSSRIVDRNGDVSIVPNAVLAGATIVNFAQPTSRHRVVVRLQAAFSNPPSRVIDMLLEAARATPGVLDDPPPAVQVHEIDDPLMGYTVHLWIDDYARAPWVASDFRRLAWYWSHRLDVPLPSPAQDLYLYDGDRTTASRRPAPSSIRAGLAGSALLAGLPDDELDRLVASAGLERFARGETIMTYGGPAELHVLVSGGADLRITAGGRSATALVLGPGDLFGVHALERQGAAAIDVVATDDCEVVVVAGDVAGGTISRTPALSAAVVQLGDLRSARVGRVLDDLLDGTGR